MAEVILKAKNLVKNYGDKQVLKGVNIEIHAGEIFGIIGSSGSGKTTLLNSLIGFVAPTSGEVLFRDPHLLSYNSAEEKHSAFRNVLQYPKQVKEIFGFAAQDPSVYGKLTVMENLDLFGSLYNLSKDSRKTNAHILLKLMGLYNSRKFYASNLSGGMIKRLDIACSLIHDPKILILDEPTADLDPYLRRHMWDLIRKVQAKGTTIIISSHYLDEIEELCDRIGIMSNGEMKQYGTPQEIKKIDDGHDEIHVKTEYKQYDVLMKKLESQKESLGISQIRKKGSELLVKSKKPLEVIELIVQVTQKTEDPIVDLRLNKPSLNEIFASFVEESHGGNLAKHQQKIELEALEILKQKWWFKVKSKLSFRKKKHVDVEDIVSQSDVDAEFDQPLTQMSSRNSEKAKNSFNLAVLFDRIKDSIPKVSRNPRPQKQTSSRSFSRNHSYRSSRSSHRGRHSQEAVLDDKADEPLALAKRFEEETPSSLPDSKRVSNAPNSSSVDDSLDDLAQIRKRIEALRKQTASFSQDSEVNK